MACLDRTLEMTACGTVLRRRVAAMQQTTGSQTQPHTDRQTRTRAPPAEGAPQEIQPAFTLAGLPRQRIKWVTTTKKTVIGIFYKTTKERGIADQHRII